MSKKTDVQVKAIELYLIPVATRIPLKFGKETLTSVTCARAKLTLEDRSGRTAVGWGETPLSVQWVWPSSLPYAHRYDSLVEFCKTIRDEIIDGQSGHPIELTYDFIEHRLPELLRDHNSNRESQSLPYLAGLLALSVFDQALHDAFGNLHEIDVYKTYGQEFLTRDLAEFITPAGDSSVNFSGKYPSDFLIANPPDRIPVWHLVGGLDPITQGDLNDNQPNDGYPLLLADWIRRDGLKCLKLKLRGNDTEWDLRRLTSIGKLGLELGVTSLSADFNCTVRDPAYVNEILDQLKRDHSEIWDMILYVEQPFPHDLEANRIDVHSLSQRKPLFLDESAHDWKFVKLGRELGWSGVALKTCKTQTGALLSLCWAKAHKMPLMVQDLTNPMLAQIPHVRLGAHAGTIMGVESNGMQFYPEASIPEQAVHPGIYQRQNGLLDLSTLSDIGFGSRVDEIGRELPAPVPHAQL